jgi:hypothetical protein
MDINCMTKARLKTNQGQRCGMVHFLKEPLGKELGAG